MKRTLSILVLVLVCCSLTSCKQIKEPKIKGELINDTIDGTISIENYVEKYEARLEEGNFDKFDQWYKVNLVGEVKAEDKEEGYNINAKIELKGKLFDAEYEFEEKGKLSYIIEMDGEVPAADDGDVKSEVKLKCTMDLTYLEGKTYIKVKMNVKVDRDTFKFTFKSNLDAIEDQLGSAMSSIGDLFDFEIFGDIMEIEIFDQIFDYMDAEYLMKQLIDATDDGSSIYLHKDKYTIKNKDEYSTDSYVENELMIASFELDEYNYQLLSYNEYYNHVLEDDESYFKVTTSVDIDTALFGSVKAPLDKAKYA